ncbi:SRPBCC family protein [Couchioplanes caeruleus]|uniref:SRPBCC family protein n=1 Tax=Couchioplanes caeruleus TaxID=56438 RepID=UPI0020C13D74|nr:SRPBCC family protein [Couchioplanes caeruleus]UQU68053.1 SRPBCC family protein [Couchioplanes caeruleus]
MTPLDPGPAGGATVVSAGDRWTLVFIRELPHPREKVWSALTDPHRLDQWAPFAAGRDLSHPGDVTLTMVDGPDRTGTPATVRRAEPPALLEYTWGEDLLRWELGDTGGGTRLTLRHTVGDRDGAPMFAAGWHLCVAVLARLLDGDPVGVIRGRDALAHGWDDLRAAYEKSFAGPSR